MIIVDAIRTPFCKMGTDLAPLSAADLGRHAVVSLLARTGIDPAEVSEVIFGCVAQPADAANLARVIALRSGIPEAVPASTVSGPSVKPAKAHSPPHGTMTHPISAGTRTRIGAMRNNARSTWPGV